MHSFFLQMNTNNTLQKNNKLKAKEHKIINKKYI